MTTGSAWTGRARSSSQRLDSHWARTLIVSPYPTAADRFCADRPEHLFQPLGLKDITFNPWARPEIKERLATLHAWDKTNHTFTPRDYPSEYGSTIQLRAALTADTLSCRWSEEDLVFVGACTGSHRTLADQVSVSTAADYLELLKVLLHEGKGTNGAQILKPETVKQMCENLNMDDDKLKRQVCRSMWRPGRSRCPRYQCSGTIHR